MIEGVALRGVRVVEVGDRIAVSACASVLAALGAEVTLIEHGEADSNHKWVDRALVAAGKQSVRVELTDGRVQALLRDADVVLTSSDVTSMPYPRLPHQIACDITAYGSSGPAAGAAHADPLIQAVTGLAHTTGEPDAPPALIGFPVTEGIAGLYAAAGVLAALRVRLRDGIGQSLEIALYDCAFSTLTTFLPFHVVGKPVARSGNRHVLAAPWNVYQARDGWVVICTGTDDQWTRLCEVIGRPELAADARYLHVSDRVAHCDAVDAAVGGWIARRDVAACVEKLQSLAISCGPIVTVGGLLDEPNLLHRGMAAAAVDPQTGREVPVPASIIKSGPRGRSPPLRLDRSDAGDTSPIDAERPCAGVKVLEIGQFTTAPLAARQLGALGAEVLKIEPPGGDAARGWAPEQDGQGYFFTFSNSDKKSLALDLASPGDRAVFKALVAESDVLVENLKPGALTRLGLGPAELSALNPRLIYCAISGFGADSAYPGRPAFDTVVQAMSGIMDLTRVNGVPQKTGISLADVLGGVFGLVAMLSALIARDASGAGEQIDISMQDAAAWVTQWCWRASYPAPGCATVTCSDGHVVAMLPDAAGMTREAEDLVSTAGSTSRAALVAALAAWDIAAAPVLTVAEAATSAQTAVRSLLIFANDPAGRRWPLLDCPIRLSETPAAVQRPIGALGEANGEVRQRLRRATPARKEVDKSILRG